MRKRASKEKKILIDREDGIFSLLSLCHLSKYTCASHMFYISVHLNIKTNVGVQSVKKDHILKCKLCIWIVYGANCAFE